MAAPELLPDLSIQLDYDAWLSEVSFILKTMNMKMDSWQDEWEFDFRKEYDGCVTPGVAAVRAHDFWWGKLLAESWT